LALATAEELGAKIYLANGGNIKNIKDVLPYLSRLSRADILFIDEIHRVHTRVQEALFTVMEDFRLDMSKGALSLSFEPFTVLGATTEAGMLLRPFYDRFLHHFTLEDYSIDELCEIIVANCKKINIAAKDSAVRAMAMRARYVPRIANSILQFCRDYAVVKNSRSSGVPYIHDSVVREAMDLKKIDEKGLDNSDRKYIMVLRRAGKPLGLNTLVATTGLSKETVENQVEPYLLKLGMIEKTSKGRQLI
jgi:Holliday junction DNA helicase RuvB